jgi:hypothetical protein
MADEENKEGAEQQVFTSVDRKGVWVFSNASFPLEDPTNAGKGPLTRFEPKAHTQATWTPWLEGQWKAGIFDKFSGHPEDDGVERIKYVEPAKDATPAPTPAPSK